MMSAAGLTGSREKAFARYSMNPPKTENAYMREKNPLFSGIRGLLKPPDTACSMKLDDAAGSEGGMRCDHRNELHLIMGRWLLLLTVLFVVVVRIRLLGFPLERDEGEYAYMGQLLLNGIPPYSHAYNMKFPGIYVAYAFFMSAFGQNIQGIHTGLLFINCALILMIFFLGKNTVSEFAGIIAAITYAVLSLSFSVLGFAAHATHYVLLPAIGGVLLLLRAMEKNRSSAYFWSGALLGLSVVILQTGVFFFIFGASYLVYRHFSSGQQHKSRECVAKLGIFAAGALLPLLVTVTWLLYSGIFRKFWFWTIVYASAYGAQVPWTKAFDSFEKGLFSVTTTFLPLWLISLSGFIITLLRRSPERGKAFVLLFVVFSFLSVCPGFYFRRHYFVTLLPAVSLCVGIFFDNFKTAGPRLIGLGIFAAVVTAGIIGHRGYFLQEDPVSLSKKIYDLQPFSESLRVADFVGARSTGADRIAVLGSEPQIFFYSKRLSADGYIYTNSLMEKHTYALSMQKEMVGEIEASDPKFIIVVQDDRSWGLTPDSVRYIFRWAKKYLQTYYHLVGVVDIISSDTTVCKWDRDARNYVVRGLSSTLIFERNPP
jgi:hypothetical protein